MASSLFADLSSALAESVAVTVPYIVEVQSHHSLASGFFWRDSLIVTPEETLAEDGDVEIELADGTVLAATRAGRDPATDIALLRVEGAPTRPVTFSFDPVRVGSLALIVAAAESAPLAAFDVVSAVGPAWHSMRNGTIDSRIEMDLRLRARAEGGLALDGQGRAFGMAVRGPRGRTIVIPAATIDRVADQLAAHGRVAIAYLGAGLRDVPVDNEGSGTMVMTVDPGGPAAAAGIKQGDIILSWDGESMPHVGTLLRRLRATTAGAQVTLSLRRGGSPKEVRVTIGNRPAR